MLINETLRKVISDHEECDIQDITDHPEQPRQPQFTHSIIRS